MWVIHWGFLLRLPWRTWVCPSEGQVWRWCSCLGCRGSGNTGCSRELAARGAGSMVEAGKRIWQPTLATILAWRTPLTEKPDRPQYTGFQRVRHYCSDPRCIDPRLFCLWQLCPGEGWAWRWTAVWVMGILMAPSVQAPDCLRCRTYEPIRVWLAIRRPLRLVFLRASLAWGPSLLFSAFLY